MIETKTFFYIYHVLLFAIPLLVKSYRNYSRVFLNQILQNTNKKNKN